METILLQSLNIEEFMESLRTTIKAELKNSLQQDQLLTKEQVVMSIVRMTKRASMNSKVTN